MSVIIRKSLMQEYKLISKHLIPKPIPSISSKLGQSELIDLFQKRISAIIIPHFINPHTCLYGADRLRQISLKDSPFLGGGKVSFSYREASEDEKKKQWYLDHAAKNIDKVRSAFLPYLSPHDLIRLKLDEIWPYGASVAKHHRSSQFFGLYKTLNPQECIVPHEDKVHREDPVRFSSPLWGQLGVHVYLDHATQGGALNLWNISLKDELYKKLWKDECGISREFLSQPSLSIRPSIGDLVIFNCTNLHAIESSFTSRIALFGFIGCHGIDKPLMVWS